MTPLSLNHLGRNNQIGTIGLVISVQLTGDDPSEQIGLPANYHQINLLTREMNFENHDGVTRRILMTPKGSE